MAKKQTKRDITLMTLLANEAELDSRKLLKEYGKPDPKNHIDLEYQLSKLYTTADDKLQLEKNLAAIHPHKKWLMQRLDLIENNSKVTPDIIVEEKIEEKANFDANSTDISSCPCPHCTMIRNSSFDGVQNKPIQSSEKMNSPMDYMGMIGMVAIVGLTFYVVAKTIK